MSNTKELHLATRIEDLDHFFVIPDVKTKKLQMLLESGKKIYREAERHYREGDEELAYVYFMKYFKLLHCIHKKPEYASHKQIVRQALGGNKDHKLIMDKVELLNNSLKRRYGVLNGSKSATHQIAASTPVDMPNTLPKKVASKANSTIVSSNSMFSTTVSSTISCKELFELIQENSVLIMDCRPNADYNLSHLTYEWSFNVPEELITKGMSAGKLQDKLDNNAKVLWSARSVKDNVVIIDWNTTNENNLEQSSSGILLDILQNWDPDITYRSQIKILLGGYIYFIMMYPTLCTNPVVQAPQGPKVIGDLIDDIEYPSIHDITMKDEIRERGFNLGRISDVGTITSSPFVPNRPTIDRSSKLGAIKTYEQKAIVEIMKEHEELVHKAEANDEELKQATKKLETLYEEKSDGGQSTRITEEKELLFNLMQLDSAAEDDNTKTNFLLDQLEIYKKIIFDQQEQISTSDLAHLEEIIKKVEMKLHERQLLNKKREIDRRKRDIQLAAVRESKHLAKDVFTEDEDNTLAKKPQFDRSIKPNLDIITRYTERIRDFSPVSGIVGKGLTGLKNLGNTCYMNSILQCLSNTPQLTEYCLTDKYKNYICRSNKTQGQIIEEFAALIKVIWLGKFKCVSSRDLHLVIGHYHKMFSGMEQQDSHEFLTIIMDWLHSDLQTLRTQVKPRDNMSASERAWLDFTKQKESLILHLFYGQIKSTVKCVECSKESATYESFSNLSLELPTNSNVCNLYQCMDMYFSGEIIHGWNCPNCKQKRDAIKKLDISKWPPVLVVHMKRFYADTDSVTLYRKKQNYVQFPLDNLDITSYIAKSESRAVTPKTYQLYSVSNHYGSMESGHYTAFSKNGLFDRWFKFDDQVVTPLDSSNVVSSAAYILFYTWLPPIQVNSSN